MLTAGLDVPVYPFQLSKQFNYDANQERSNPSGRVETRCDADMLLIKGLKTEFGRAHLSGKAQFCFQESDGSRLTESEPVKTVRSVMDAGPVSTKRHVRGELVQFTANGQLLMDVHYRCFPSGQKLAVITGGHDFLIVGEGVVAVEQRFEDRHASADDDRVPSRIRRVSG